MTELLYPPCQAEDVVKDLVPGPGAPTACMERLLSDQCEH